MSNANFNQICKEEGHLYYECTLCGGANVSELITLECEDCEEETIVILTRGNY